MDCSEKPFSITISPDDFVGNFLEAIKAHKEDVFAQVYAFQIVPWKVG
jgi:hypothetical protein